MGNNITIEWNYTTWYNTTWDQESVKFKINYKII